MPGHEYRVVPAPARGRKAPGVKTPEGRFALGIEDILNEMARDGWRYLRSDILPSEERQGLTSTTTVYRSVLVFERALPPAPDPEPEPETQPSAESMARSLIPDHPEN
ncbi:MAG: DUF4177 domain-containing protein [Roseovarius sp.]|nr:DUF4177 domain-containing protein [Roseovarius sp.]